MYYLISLLVQNCLPAGYLPSVLSGKEFGMVGLTLDSTSQAETKWHIHVCVTRVWPVCCQALFCSVANARCPLGPWGSVSHATSATPGTLEPALPYWQFQGGAALIPKSPHVQPTELCAPSIWSNPVEGGHTSKSKTLLGNPFFLVLQGRLWLKDYLIFTMAEHCISRLATSACRIKVTSLFSPWRMGDVCLTIVCDPFCWILQTEEAKTARPPLSPLKWH